MSDAPSVRSRTDIELLRLNPKNMVKVDGRTVLGKAQKRALLAGHISYDGKGRYHWREAAIRRSAENA